MMLKSIATAVAAGAAIWLSAAPASANALMGNQSAAKSEIVATSPAANSLLAQKPSFAPKVHLAQGKRRGKVRGRSNRRSNAGRNAAIGIGAAIIGGIIASEIARSQPRRAYSRSTCRTWARRCDYGNRRACHSYRRYCY